MYIFKKIFNLFYEEIKYFLKKNHFIIVPTNKPENSLIRHTTNSFKYLAQ